MKKTLLTTLNAKYIHKNLALRWFYVTCPKQDDVILKEYTIKEDIDYIVDDIIAMNVEVVCLSTYIWNIEQHKELIIKLKAKNTDIHIIIGGPEVSFESYDLLDIGVDAISIGEGEISLWQYIEMLSNNEQYEVAGIYTKAFPNNEYQKVDLAYLEQFESPYFLAMDQEDMGKRYFYLETSRGCPYNCSYCLSSTDNRLRMFSLDYVMKILTKLKDSEVKQVKLLDRTFNADPKRALTIASYMNDYCLKQTFQFEVVAETISDELFDFFTTKCDVNRFRFEIGVQSFNSKTLKAVGRIQNNERLLQVIQAFKKAGCVMHVDLIAALPYEDFASFKDSFNTLFKQGANELQLGILKLLKGTKLKLQQEEFGFVYDHHAPYDVSSTNWLSNDELKQLHEMHHALEKYYNNGFMRNCIDIILALGWVSDPFTLFHALGMKLKKLARPYQPYQLLIDLKEVLSHIDERLVDSVILFGYYANTKQKPKRFTKHYLDTKLQHEIYNLAFDKGIANEDTLHRYGLCDVVYYDHEFGYQLVLYNNKQQKAIRYFINEDINLIKEMV